MAGKEFEEILTRLDTIETRLERQSNWKKNIPSTIMRGVLASFGATIVFGIVLVFAAKLIQSSQQIPILNDLIDKTKLEKVVDAYNEVEVTDVQPSESVPDANNP